MDQKFKFDEKNFNQMESEILKEVLNTSKSIIETFKFRMIYGSSINPSKAKKTLTGLKKFRKENWDTKLVRNEAYKKYLNLY